MLVLSEPDGIRRTGRAAGRHPARHRVRGRAAAGDRQAGRTGGASGQRQLERHPAQCAAASCARDWPTCRAPASCTGSTRTPAACWWWPRRWRRRPIWCASCRRARVQAPVSGAGASGTCARDGTVDAPIGRHPRAAHQDGGGAGNAAASRRVTHYPDARANMRYSTLLECCAGNRAHAPDPRAHGVDQPSAGRRSGVWQGRIARCGAARFPRQALHATRLALVHPLTRAASMQWEVAAAGDDMMSCLLETRCARE